jgi:predicted  nucleic acid-binding Zn-ribbon protein
MSERVRATKRRTAAVQDEVRAAETRCELETSKKRYKTLRVLTCEYAQEIIELKNQIVALKKQTKDLQEKLGENQQ